MKMGIGKCVGRIKGDAISTHPYILIDGRFDGASQVILWTL